MPFSDVRGDFDTINETDFGYTGQRDVSEIDLMDYKARFYGPALGRMTQPDTIIPNLGNPQSLNRYSYVGNNPIRYTDPTGHFSCEDPDGECKPPPAEVPDNTPDLVTFDPLGKAFSPEEQRRIRQAANDVAAALAREINAMNRLLGKLEGATIDNVSREEAFLGVYGGPVTFRKIDDLCAEGCFARTRNRNLVWVYSNAVVSTELIVHELGHAFNLAAGGSPYDASEEAMRDPNFPRKEGDCTQNTDGFHGYCWIWQQSDDDTNFREEFADMFLGWVYGEWEEDDGDLTADGSARAAFMNSGMPGWAAMAFYP